MMYSSKSLPARPEDFTTVEFVFGSVDDHPHELSYPVTGDTLTVIVENTDRIQDVDLSYCRCRIVWLRIPAAEQRRGIVLWNELLKPENQPQAMYTDSSKGLFMYLPQTKKGVHFNAEH